MEKEVKRNSEIKFRIGLNASNVPVQIDIQSEEGPAAGQWVPAKALLISLFDQDTLDTLKIDLWTTNFQISEMDRFMYQTLRGLADTYFKATQNRDLAVEMQKFIQFFGEQTEVLPKSS